MNSYEDDDKLFIFFLNLSWTSVRKRHDPAILDREELFLQLKIEEIFMEVFCTGTALQGGWGGGYSLPPTFLLGIPDFVTICKLLLINPATTATAECSFSRDVMSSISRH